MKLPTNPEFPLIYLWPLRVWVGASFLFAGEFKISQGAWGADYASNLEEFIKGNIDDAYGFYQPFLESIVLPNTHIFAVLVGWGELLFGLSVFLGLFTRFGAIVGILIIFNFTFAVGRGIWLPGMDAAYIWALFTLLICGSGRIWGIDQILRERWNIKWFK